MLAELFGIEQVKVMESTYNVAGIGQEADMQFICDSKGALLCYASGPVGHEVVAGWRHQHLRTARSGPRRQRQRHRGMKLEELIYSRISGAEYGSPGLAAFDGAPAIFFGPCPEDTDRGWEDGRQYPRISYGLDLRGDPERQTAGTLYVDVLCSEDGPAPEDIEPVLRAVLCGVIMAPEDDNPCSFSWQVSQTFQPGVLYPAIIL